MVLVLGSASPSEQAVAPAGLFDFVRGGPEIALVVAATMVMIVMVGSTIEFLLPLGQIPPTSRSVPLTAP